LQDGGEERGLIKDDIPEEFVSMEWMEEHDEEDSESWKRKHIQKKITVRTWAKSVLCNSQCRSSYQDNLSSVISSTTAHRDTFCLGCKPPPSRCLSVTQGNLSIYIHLRPCGSLISLV
jgi:hypothetical protein